MVCIKTRCYYEILIGILNVFILDVCLLVKFSGFKSDLDSTDLHFVHSWIQSVWLWGVTDSSLFKTSYNLT